MPGESTVLLLCTPIGVLALTSEQLAESRRRAAEFLPGGLGMPPETLSEPASRVRRPPLLDAAQAAEALGIDASWLLTQARIGAIPHVRLGKYVRFDPQAIVVRCAEPVTRDPTIR